VSSVARGRDTPESEPETGQTDANRSAKDTEPPVAMSGSIGPCSGSGSKWVLVQVFAPGRPGAFTPVECDVQNGDRLLGRGAPIPIDDPAVSRHHAQLTGEAGRVFVTDLSSANGTFVNGRRLTTSTVLEDGDVLRTGDSLFVLHLGGPGSSHRETAERLARSTLPVVIQGETGTGKEVLAQLIHEKSERSGPFIPVNCATLGPSLTESELFGHKRGAFSGASEPRDGLFVCANRGTLFLDEMPDLSLPVQGKLLRVLETQRVRPLGADHEVRIDTRLIAASPVNLVTAVEAGSFRRDLYERLAGRMITLAPLRACRARILPLFAELARERRARFRLTTEAAEWLLLYSWPGNVRELKMLVQRAVEDIRHDTEGLRLLDGTRLQACMGGGAVADNVGSRASSVSIRTPSSTSSVSGRALVTTRRTRPSRCEIEQALSRCGGNVSATARLLGRRREVVQRWIKTHGLK